MKKTISILTVLMLLAIIACNAPGKKESNKEETQRTSVEDPQTTPESKNKSESETKTIEARFMQIIASADGPIYVFKDEDGKNYEFYATDKSTGLAFTHGLRQGEPPVGFENKRFKVTYKMTEKETSNIIAGENKTREVPVIVEIEEIENDE